MRESFRLIQVRLSYKVSYELPSLDVETRWYSLHDIIQGCYKLRDIFNIICKDPTFVEKLNEFALSDDEWGTVATLPQFLIKLAAMIKSLSEQSYATLSM